MAEHSEFLLLDEVARRCRVPLSTVRHWIAVGKLQSGRFARRRVVRAADLDRFIAAGFSAAAPTTTTEAST
jgi:excisionase family DNA binding protein